MRCFFDPLGCNLSSKYSWHNDVLVLQRKCFKILRAPNDSKKTMSWFWAPSSPLPWFLFHCLVLLPLVAASGSSYFCSKSIYDSPDMRDCSYALAAVPQADGFLRYYIEQQLATGPPDFNWRDWKDERPSPFQTNKVQVPKFWNYGKEACLREGHVNPVRGALQTLKQRY